ncbi:MAG: ABC transporter permease [Candidatus Lambdaproteobacteria bacterium]|nr:ABC transporter permease [Candidatus Lambdaproteobacteria bacterium]
MSFGDSILTALGALKLNAMRSVLTMLGIIIGVAAVITMVAVGAGAEARVAEQIRSLGSNLIIVLSGSASAGGARLGSGSQLSITEDDAAAIQREVSPVQYAAPSVRGSAQVVSGNQNVSTSVQGITPDYLEVREWSITSGRGFTPDEMRSAGKVALLGQTVVDNLFPGQDPLGQSIRIKKVPLRVIGTLERKGQSMMGQDQDDLILVPIATAKTRVLGGNRFKGRAVSAIMVKVREGEDMAAAEEELKNLLRQRHRIQAGQPDDFYVRNLSEIMQAREASSRVLKLLLAAVASVSLLVGGIGIMNIMLVSVTERTREIGLRLAVGASGRAVQTQFLVEAVTLALIGGLIGIALGIGSAMVIARLADWPTLLQPSSIALAFGFSGAVGIFFGYYPARKAAGLNPIDALRHE